MEFLISANNSTWEKAGGTMFREAEAGSVSYILLDEAVYGRYVRMVIPDTPSGTEVANLSVYSGTEGQKKLEAVAADQYTEISGPAAVNDSGETYENLFDDNLSTKWYIQRGRGAFRDCVPYRGGSYGSEVFPDNGK